MISCIAIDDEPLALELILNYCYRIDFLELKKTFTKPSEALIYLSKFPVDLLFLDIQMPDISGIDFYKSLNRDMPVIFTTAFSEYAVEGFNLSAVDYLLKPIRFGRFEQAVIKTKEYIDFQNNKSSTPNKFLVVRSGYKLMKIAFSDILFIQGLDNYVRIFIDQSKPVMSRVSMKDISAKLPRESFERVHRSYIVNLEKVNSYRGRKIQIGNRQIPVGISFENGVKHILGIH
jgi:DNA-binding LytR/AlgR family response regulator